MKLRRALAKLAGDRRREPADPPASPTQTSADDQDDTDFAAHGSDDGPPRDLSITFTLVDRPRDDA
jgi:hypothetical protein